MRLVISLVLIALLMPESIRAQYDSNLGSSCRASQKLISIPEIAQERDTQWCWATAAVNIMNYHGESETPCKAVESTYNSSVSQCCDNDRNNPCRWRGGWAEWVFDLPKPHFSYLPSKTVGTTLTWKGATEEICNDRPYISALDFVEGDLHVVVVTGYTTLWGVNEIIFYDPLDDDYFTEEYDLFASDYPAISGLQYGHYRDTYQIFPVQQ